MCLETGRSLQDLRPKPIAPDISFGVLSGISVNGFRRCVAECLVWSIGIVTVEPSGSAIVNLRWCVMTMKIEIFVFVTTPEPFDKDVVKKATTSVHTNLDREIKEL